MIQLRNPDKIDKGHSKAHVAKERNELALSRIWSTKDDADGHNEQ